MSVKARAVLLALLMLLAAWLPALGETPAVDDQAEVLPLDMAEEITSYSARMAQELGVPFRLITKHFLGGKNVQQYADQALEIGADSRAVVLVMVIGEETYALAIGEQTRPLLSPERAESMLGNTFHEPFVVERDYGRAVAAFLLDLSATLQSRAGKRVADEGKLPSYAGRAISAAPAATASPTAYPTGGTSWLDSILEDKTQSEHEAREYETDVREAQEGSGRNLSLFQIALIGFILFKIFGRKKNGGKNGCGPLGWIFGTWGLSKFFGWRK